jgi:hypothetical protein
MAERGVLRLWELLVASMFACAFAFAAFDVGFYVWMRAQEVR